MTLREHLTEVAQSDRAARQALLGPPLPEDAHTAWGVFNRLHRRRPIGAQSIDPLTHRDMLAFCELAGQPLTPLDVQLIEIIDDAFVASIAEAMAPDPSPDAPPAES